MNQHKNRKSNIKNITLCAMFTALIAVLSQIQVALGPVPFNLAVFAVFLAGIMLAPIWAACSVFVYMALGFVGVPVFAGFKGGPAILFGATGGYIWGYLILATITALALRHFGNRFIVLLCMAIGLLALYALGTAWFMFVTKNSLQASLTMCVYPFVFVDICKAICAYVLGTDIVARLKKANIF